MRLISDESADFLLGLLGGLTLNVSAPDFDDAVAAIQKARSELLTAFEPPSQ